MPKINTKQVESALCTVTGKLYPPGGGEIAWWLKTGGVYNGVIYTRDVVRVPVGPEGDFAFDAPPSDSIGPIVVDFGKGHRAEVEIPSGVSTTTFNELSHGGRVKWIR